MSREYQERIKPINRDGEASIKAQMRECYRKAKVARTFGNSDSEKANMKKFYELEKRLAGREEVTRLRQ